MCYWIYERLQAPFGKWPQVPILSCKKALLGWKLSFWGCQRIPPSWPESALKFSWVSCLWRPPPATLAKTNSLSAGPPLSISARCLSLLLYLDHEHFGTETLFQYYGIQWSWSMVRTLRYYWKKRPSNSSALKLHLAICNSELGTSTDTRQRSRETGFWNY